jgi:hypothetical protein
MSLVSATISEVIKQHYEAPLRAANAIGTCRDRDIELREA